MHFISPNRTIAQLSVTAVLFFSYIPLIYLFSFFGMEKITVYAGLLIVIALLSLGKLFPLIVKGTVKPNAAVLLSFALYMVFVLYAGIRAPASADNIIDTVTIRTIVLINPIMIVLALLSRDNKKDVLKWLYVLSGIYFVLMVLSLITGNLIVGSTSFQNIFRDMDGDYYQNINIYLGIFIISNIGLLAHNNKIIASVPKVVIPISVIGMLLIGGRASVIAIAMIMLIYFLFMKKSAPGISSIMKYLLVFISLMIVGVLYLADIANFLTNSITIRRMLALSEEGDSSSRIYLFSKAIELFLKDNTTVLVGGGINSFSRHVSYTYAYPHNLVLELLAEYGVIGAVLFALPAIYILKTRKIISGAIWGTNNEEQMVFILFIYYLIMHLFTGGMKSSWVLVYFLFLLLPSPRSAKKIRANLSRPVHHHHCLFADQS